MSDFFYNAVSNNQGVNEKLKYYFKSSPYVRDAAASLAHHLVSTKDFSRFSEGIRSMQRFTKKYNSELSDLYPLMVFAVAADLILEKNLKAGIPEEVTTATLKDTNIWMDNFYQFNGRYGVMDFDWLARHYAGNLFKIGRLQYEIIPFPDWAFIFKNNATQELTALSDEAKVTASGHITGSAGEEDCAFQTDFTVSEEGYQGYIINMENGVILNEKVKLNKNEWKLILQPGDMVLNIHIPQGEKLDYNMCLDSMAQAEDFFRKYFPDIRCKALVSSTWLLDVNLLHILPEESNIIKFMKLFHKLPVCVPLSIIYERVFGFGFDIKDIASAPENTSLQRRLKEYTVNGGKIYSSGGFIIAQDG